MISEEGQSFDISFKANGTHDARDFSWAGSIIGSPDGTIEFTFTGQARSPFIRNRLGLCLLHPILETAGKACVVEQVDGTLVESAFPTDISPHQPFVSIRAITHEVIPGVSATVRFTGEVFETEDHRNWGDASFKTYCTPITLPFPVTVQAGDELQQSISLSLGGEAPMELTEGRNDPVVITVSEIEQRLPRVGVQLDTDGHQLTPTELGHLRDLRLDHVRFEVHAADRDATVRLLKACEQAEAIGARVIVALFISEDADLERFRAFGANSTIDSWLVFSEQAKVSTSAALESARQVLGHEMPDRAARLGGGTNLYFTELNRQPAKEELLDLVSFSLNPQVHATDDQTLIQNTATHGLITANARRLYPDTPITVGPITLRPRFNPNATEPLLDVSNTDLPSNEDARQATWFGAAWVALSIKYLADAGVAESLTYFEATGARGLMEKEGGARYPMWQVFADLAEFTHARRCTSNRPQEVDGLLLVNGSAQRLLLANLTDRVINVRIDSTRAPLVYTLEPCSLTRYDYREELT